MKGTIVDGSRGRYAILAEAGEGGVGTVYKAKDISSGDVVALKVLHSKRFELNDIQRERFFNEITASLDVSSPYIVSGLDSGEYKGEPFLVLEWLSGGTLQQLIESGDYVTDDVIAITAQLLKAFHDLQRLGLIHRDLKPNNVLMTADRRMKLSDLGLVRKVAAPAYLTASDAHIGSLLYISERQRFSPDEATSRDDFYSLSLILYELVSRRRIHNRNVPLLYLRPDIAPIALCSLIDQGMQDLDDWQETRDELCSYIDLDGECIDQHYTGSVLVPEHLIQTKVDSLFARAGSTSSSEEVEETASESPTTLLQDVVDVIARAFDDCAREFRHCGVTIGIAEEPEDTGEAVYFWASFNGKLDILLDEKRISEDVNDRLFGWIGFTTLDDGSIQIDGVGGKRLYADCSHVPDDMCDRVIAKLDDETRVFLRHVGRAVAVGAGLGAIERIEDLLEEAQHSSHT